MRRDGIKAVDPKRFPCFSVVPWIISTSFHDVQEQKEPDQPDSNQSEKRATEDVSVQGEKPKLDSATTRTRQNTKGKKERSGNKLIITQINQGWRKATK